MVRDTKDGNAEGFGGSDASLGPSGEGESLADGIDIGGELRRCLASFRRLKQLLLSPETPPEVLGKLLQQPSLQQRLSALRSSFLSSVDRALPPSVAPSYRSSLRALRLSWRRRLRLEAGGSGGEEGEVVSDGGGDALKQQGPASTAPCCSCCSVPSEAVLFELVSAYLLRRLSESQQLLLPAFHPSLLRETIDITQPGVLRELSDLLLDEQLCMFWCITFICHKAAEAALEENCSSRGGKQSPTLGRVCLSFARRLIEENDAEAELLRSYSHLNAPCDPTTCFFLERGPDASREASNASAANGALREARELHDLSNLQHTLQLQSAAAFSLAAVHRAAKAIRVLGRREKFGEEQRRVASPSDFGQELLGSSSSEQLYRFCERVKDDHFCGALAACSGEKRALLRSRSLLRDGIQLAGASAALVLAAYPLEVVKDVWQVAQKGLGDSSSQATAFCSFVESSSFVSLHRDVMCCCMQSIKHKLERQQEQQLQLRQGGGATVQPLTDVYEDLLYSCYIEQPSVASVMLAAHGVILSTYRALRFSSLVPQGARPASAALLSLEEIDAFLGPCSDFVFPLLISALQLLLRHHDGLQQQGLHSADPLGEAFASQLFCLLDGALLTWQFDRLQSLDGAVLVACELLALLPSQRELLAAEFCARKPASSDLPSQGGPAAAASQRRLLPSGFLRLVKAFTAVVPYGLHALFQLLGALLPQSAFVSAPLQSAVDGEDAECEVADASQALRFIIELSSPLKSILLPPVPGAVRLAEEKEDDSAAQGIAFVACTPLPVEMCVLTLLNFHQSTQQASDSRQPSPVFEASSVNGGVSRWTVLLRGATGMFEEVRLWRMLSCAAASFAEVAQLHRESGGGEGASREAAPLPLHVLWATEAEGRILKEDRLPAGSQCGGLGESPMQTKAPSRFLVASLRWPLNAVEEQGQSIPSRGRRLSLLTLVWLVFDAGLKHQEQQCGPMDSAAFRAFVSACGFWMKVAALPSAARMAVEALIADQVYGLPLAAAGSSVAASSVSPWNSALNEAPFLLLPRIYALVCLAASSPQLHLLLPEGLNALRLSLAPAYLTDVNRCLAFLSRQTPRCLVELPPPQQQEPLVAPEMIHFGWRFLQCLIGGAQLGEAQGAQSPSCLPLPVLLQRISAVTEALELQLRVFPVVLASLRLLLQLLKTVPPSTWTWPFQLHSAMAAAAALEGLLGPRGCAGSEDSGGSRQEELGLTEAYLAPTLHALLGLARETTDAELEASVCSQVAAFAGLCSYAFTGVWGRLEGWSFLQPAERCQVVEVLLRLLLQLLSLLHFTAESVSAPLAEDVEKRGFLSLQNSDSPIGSRRAPDAVAKVQLRQKEMLSAFLEALAASDVPSGLVGVVQCLLLCFPAPGEAPGVPWGETRSDASARDSNKGLLRQSVRLSFASSLLRVFGSLDAATFARSSAVTAAAASLLATPPLSGSAPSAGQDFSSEAWGSIFLPRRSREAGAVGGGGERAAPSFSSDVEVEVEVVQLPETLLPDVVSLEPFSPAVRWSSVCWLRYLERLEVWGFPEDGVAEAASAAASPSASALSSVYGAAGLSGASTVAPCGERSQRVVLSSLLSLHHLLLACCGAAGRGALAALSAQVARLTSSVVPPSPLSGALLPSAADGLPAHAGDLLALHQRREFETLLAAHGLRGKGGASGPGTGSGNIQLLDGGEEPSVQTVICRVSFPQSLLAFADSRAKVTAAALLSLLCVFWKQRKGQAFENPGGGGLFAGRTSLAAALSYEPPELEESLAVGGSLQQTLSAEGFRRQGLGEQAENCSSPGESRQLVKEFYTNAFASRLLRHLYLNESRYAEFRLSLLQLLMLAADSQTELLLVGESRAFEGAVTFAQQTLHDVLSAGPARRGPDRETAKAGEGDADKAAVSLGELKALRLSLLVLERLLTNRDASAAHAALAQLSRQTKTGIPPLGTGDSLRAAGEGALPSAEKMVSGGWRLLGEVAEFVVRQWKRIRWKRGLAWLKQASLCGGAASARGGGRSPFVGNCAAAFGSQSRLLASLAVDLPLYTNGASLAAPGSAADSEEFCDDDEAATPLLAGIELCGCLQSLVNSVRVQLRLLPPYISDLLGGAGGALGRKIPCVAGDAAVSQSASADFGDFLRVAFYLTASQELFGTLFPTPLQRQGRPPAVAHKSPEEDFDNPGLLPLPSALAASEQLERVSAAKGIHEHFRRRAAAFDSLWGFPVFSTQEAAADWRQLTDSSLCCDVNVLRASSVRASAAQHGLGFGFDGRALVLLAAAASLRDFRSRGGDGEEENGSRRKSGGDSQRVEETVNLARLIYAFPWEAASLAPRAAVALSFCESQGLLFCAMRGLLKDCRDASLFPLYEPPGQPSLSTRPPFEAALFGVLEIFKQIPSSRRDLLSPRRRSFLEQLGLFASQLLSCSWVSDLLASSFSRSAAPRRGSVSASLELGSVVDFAEQSAVPLEMLHADESQCVAAIALNSRVPLLKLPFPRSVPQLQALLARQPLPRGVFALPTADSLDALARLTAESLQDGEGEAPEEALREALAASLRIAEFSLLDLLSAEGGEAESLRGVLQGALDFASVASATWSFFFLKRRTECGALRLEEKTETKALDTPLQWREVLSAVVGSLFECAFRCAAEGAPESLQFLFMETANAVIASAGAAALAFHKGQLSGEQTSGNSLFSKGGKALSQESPNSLPPFRESLQSGAVNSSQTLLSPPSPSSAAATSPSPHRRSSLTGEKTPGLAGGGGSSSLEPFAAAQNDLCLVLASAVERLQREGERWALATAVEGRASQRLGLIPWGSAGPSQALSPLAFFSRVVEASERTPRGERAQDSLAGRVPLREVRALGLKGTKRMAVDASRQLSRPNGEALRRDFSFRSSATREGHERCASGARRISLLCQSFSSLVEGGSLLPENAFASSSANCCDASANGEARLELLRLQLSQAAASTGGLLGRPCGNSPECGRRLSAAELLLQEGFFQRLLLQEPLLSFVVGRAASWQGSRESKVFPSEEGLQRQQRQQLGGGLSALGFRDSAVLRGSAAEDVGAEGGEWRAAYDAGCICICVSPESAAGSAGGGYGGSLRRAASHVALCRVLRLFERTLQWLRKHRYSLLLHGQDAQGEVFGAAAAQKTLSREQTARLQHRLVPAVFGVLKLLQRRAKYVMENAVQQGRLALLEEATVYVRVLGALPPWAFLSGEEKRVVSDWMTSARRLAQTSLRSLDAALFASTPTLRAFSFFELNSGASCTDREGTDGLLLHTRRSAGGISSVSAFTKPSAAVRDQAEPGTRAAIPSVLHQRGLVLLLECIRGFAVALQRSTLVLPFSHQLPPPQSLCLPLVAGDDAAARGADFSQSSPQTPNAPAATAVSPEVYVQLLHSADASSRSASASGDALGCVFHKEHLPLDGVFTSDGKGASCVGSGGGSFRPNPLSCCVPPLTMRAGMLGKNLLGSRSRGATGLSSLAAPSEFSVGAHSHGHPREEEEDSGSSTLTVQWFGATLQQLTSAIKVLQRALELGQRLEDEKVVCLLTASGQRLVPLSTSLLLEDKVLLPSAPAGSDSNLSLPKTSQPGGGGASSVVSVAGVSVSQGPTTTNVFYRQRIASSRQLSRSGALLFSRLRTVSAPRCICRRSSGGGTLAAGVVGGGGLSGVFTSAPEQQQTVGAEYWGRSFAEEPEEDVVDEEWEAACAPLVSVRGLQEILSATLQQTAAVGAGIVNTLVAGNVLRFQEEAAKQFVSCLARLASCASPTPAVQATVISTKRQPTGELLQTTPQQQHSQLGPSSLSGATLSLPILPASAGGKAGGGGTAAAPLSSSSQDSAEFFSAILAFVRRRLEVEEKVVQRFGAACPLVLQSALSPSLGNFSLRRREDGPPREGSFFP